METAAAAAEPAALRITRRLGLRFALLYAGIASVLFSIYAFPCELFGARGDWLSGYLAAYARLSGGLLGLFEHGVVVEGAYIHGRFALQIVRNCDAADVNILFGSALLAFPAPLVKKAFPLMMGLSSLVAANVVRICSLYYVGVYRPEWFRAAHEEVWPLLLVAFALFVFLVSIRHLEGPSPSGPS